MLRAMLLGALALLLWSARLAAQEPPAIRSGPMVGYGAMREVRLWVQTAGPAEVQFRYNDTENPDRIWTTVTVTTRAETAYVAEVAADSVEPGRRYDYEVWVDAARVEAPYPLTFQTPAPWRRQGEPPPFTIALASCFYVNEPGIERPGEPYGGDFHILSAVSERSPDLMLWLGDNTYLREVDWGSRSGILDRYTHTRALPELQPLLGSVHHLALWDDHDYGPENSDRSYVGKAWTREAFDLFWANPPVVEGLDGITTAFAWQDVEFFLLDNRWYRTPNGRRTGDREMLGERQLTWLVDALVSSEAPFKIVAMGGQVLNTASRFRLFGWMSGDGWSYPAPCPCDILDVVTCVACLGIEAVIHVLEGGSGCGRRECENYAQFPRERARLLQRIRAERIPGVLFVSGDRHHTELSRLDRGGTYPLYDLTVSPLTAGVSSPDNTNALRVPGTYVRERNFGLLSFDGPRNDRRMTMTIVGADGREHWSHTVRAADLR